MATGKPRLITAYGRTQSLAQWSRETGIYERTIAYRLDTCHLTPEQALLRDPLQAKNKPSVHQYVRHRGLATLRFDDNEDSSWLGGGLTAYGRQLLRGGRGLEG